MPASLNIITPTVVRKVVVGVPISAAVGGSVNALGQLTDVDLSLPLATGDFLQWAGTWQNISADSAFAPITLQLDSIQIDLITAIGRIDSNQSLMITYQLLSDSALTAFGDRIVIVEAQVDSIAGLIGPINARLDSDTLTITTIIDNIGDIAQGLAVLDNSINTLAFADLAQDSAIALLTQADSAHDSAIAQLALADLAHDSDIAALQSAIGSTSGLADGDYGDILVNSNGTIMTIDAGVVTLANLADITTASFLGRDSAGTGSPQVLTAARARIVLNVADGATANDSDGALRARSTHTGTQDASTITGLAPIATSGSAADLTTGILPAVRFNDSAHGSRAGGALHSAATITLAGFMSAADKLKLDSIAANANNYVHPNHSGDVTSIGDGVITIDSDVVTNVKLANMAANTIKGRDSTGTGDPLDLTPAQAWGIIDSAALNTAQNWTKAQGSAPVALVDGANIATDASLSNVFTVTLAGNRTLDNPTNLVAGRTYVWVITQDGSGAHTLAYGSYFDFPGGTAPTIASGANDVSLITGIAISTTRILCVANLDFS